MNDLLFDIPETKSPKLQWMELNRIRVYKNQECKPPWFAIGHELDEDGNDGEISARGETEDEAIVALCLKLNLKLWNE